MVLMSWSSSSSSRKERSLASCDERPCLFLLLPWLLGPSFHSFPPLPRPPSGGQFSRLCPAAGRRKNRFSFVSPSDANRWFFWVERRRFLPLIALTFLRWGNGGKAHDFPLKMWLRDRLMVPWFLPAIAPLVRPRAPPPASLLISWQPTSSLAFSLRFDVSVSLSPLLSRPPESKDH